MSRRSMAGLAALLLLPVLWVAQAGPATAAGRVSVTSSAGTATIDGRYSTTLTVSGSGFQSIKGGHGGVYVWFGTVSGTWRPSQGGVSGSNYLYVPDSETADNQGFQRYVAFPGSDTASSAAAVMSTSGAWSVKLTVPGPTFKAVGRNGTVTTVDCRTVQCGVITVGAHGVKNANNETFTPVKVADLQQAAPSTANEPETPSTDEPSAPGSQETTPAVPTGKPKLEVDRTSAVAGRVLSFTGTGLPPGKQLSVVFDDGVAAAGPFQVSTAGELVGVIPLPADVAAGTHTLRIYGLEDAPTVNFAVRAAETPASSTQQSADDSGQDGVDTWGKVFAGFGAALLLVAIARLLLMVWRSRRAS